MDKERRWNAPVQLRPRQAAALLAGLFAAALCTLAAGGPFGTGAPTAVLQKQRPAAVSRKPEIPLRRAAAESGWELPAVPAFTALFGDGGAAQAYCDALPGSQKAPAIVGYARAWLWETELAVPVLLQLPQLPNGCEATSLAAMLRYHGIAANKTALAHTYIPRADFAESRYGRLGPDPERAYPGDPATESGFYCFAAPLAQGANRYLREKGSSLHAVNVTGITEEGLRGYLRAGEPVAVWVTLDLSEPYTGGFAWIIEKTGEVYTPYLNLHCVVLMGWGRDTCTLMDPLRGVCTVDREAFLDSFEQLGRRALVIR